MKKKLILIALIGGILSTIIYFYTKNDDITLVAIGDGLAQGMTSFDIEGASFNDYLKEYYSNKHELKDYYEYAESNKTVKELIYEMKENKKILFKNDTIELQHAINEADILTVAIGMDELINKKYSSKAMKELESDMDELLSMIKMLNHKKVFVLGFYNKDIKELLTIEKLNAYLRDICYKNNFIFVDIAPLLKEPKYYFEENKHYINYLGHEQIFYELKKQIS